MKRIKLYIKQNKKLLGFYFGVGCIVLVYAILMYKFEIVNAMNQPIIIWMQEAEDCNENIPLSNGIEVRQEIRMVNSTFTGVSLWMDEGINEKNEIITIALYDDKDNLIEKWGVDSKDVIGNGLRFFQLEKQLHIKKDDIYTLVIKAPACESPVALLKVLQNTAKGHDNRQQYLPLGETESGKLILGIDGEYSLSYGILDGWCHSLRYFYAMIVAGVFLLILIACILQVRGTCQEWIFAIMAFIVGGIYLCTIPPYVVPDEPAHFVTVYAESSIILDKQPVDDQNNVLLGPDGAGYFSLDAFPGRESYVNFIKGLTGKEENNITEVTSSGRGALDMHHLGYVPQVLGITIGRIIGLNSEWLFLAGRLTALIWYCIVMFWSIRIIPRFGKNILYIIGLMPMTIQQVVSYNYDSVLLGMSFFCIAYLLYLACEDEKMYITYKDCFLLSLALIVIVPIKCVYLPLIGLGILIPAKKFGGIRKKIMVAILLLLIGGGVIILTNMARITDITSSTAVSWTTQEMYSLSTCLKDPLRIAAICLRTIQYSFSFYVESMIATPLGWLEMGVPSIVVSGYIVLLLLGMLQQKNEIYVWKDWERIWMALIVVIIVALTGFALLLSWTPVEAMIIQGIQGRYFIPILPVILLVLLNGRIVLEKKIDNIVIAGTNILQIITIFSVVILIMGRQ